MDVKFSKQNSDSSGSGDESSRAEGEYQTSFRNGHNDQTSG